MAGSLQTRGQQVTVGAWRPHNFEDVLAHCTSVKRQGSGQATADCPCGHHKHPGGHLSLTDKGDLCLAHCNPGPGTYEEICSGLGTSSLTYSSNGNTPIAERRTVAVYDYQDTDGKLLFQVVRFDPKDFRQRRPDGAGGYIWNLEGIQRVLYQLPKLTAWVREGRTIFIPEGEKDADNLIALGLAATTSSGGAGKWRPEYGDALVGADVVILADNDEPGLNHADDVRSKLRGKAAAVRVVRLPNRNGLPVKDVSEWLALGGTRAELEALVAAAAEPSQSGALPFQTARELALSEPETVEWVIKGIVARKAITELDAKVKQGKTTLALGATADLLAGRPFLGLSTTSCAVLYLTEEGRASFKAGLARVGLTDQDNLHVLCRGDVRSMEWPDVMSKASAYALEVGAGLIIVDTLSRWAGLKDDNENDAGAAAAALEPLEAAAATGLAVLLLRHDRKGGGDLGDSGRGSSAFSGGADIVLALRRADAPGHENRRRLEGIGRFEETPAALTVELEDGRYVSLGDSAAVDRDEARAGILDRLPPFGQDPKLQKDLEAQLASIGRTTVQRALNALVTEGRIVKYQKLGPNKKGNGYTLEEGVGDG